MTRYKNLSGRSGVYAYETGPNYISVEFNLNGKPRVYTYSNRRAGRHHVSEMKMRAFCGCGLNTYINQFVKKLYD